MTTSMKHLFLATSAMPCEVGVGALFEFLEGVYVSEHGIEEANKGNLLEYIKIRGEHFDSIVLLGTYWIKTLDEAARALKQTSFLLYSSGDVSNEQAASFPINVSVRVPQENNLRSGPVYSVVDFYDVLNLTNNAFRALIGMHTRSIKDIEDRMLSRNVNETEIFVSGLYNHSFFDKKVLLSQRFASLFMGEVDRESLLSVGKTVVDCKSGMAYNRARGNSKIVEAPTGTKFAVTTAPDIINLTHEQLKLYHKIDKTLVLNFILKQESEQLHISFRSFDDESILGFAKAHEGGGSASAAAAHIDFSIPWNRIFAVPDQKQ